jgi:hypothetical protein
MSNEIIKNNNNSDLAQQIEYVKYIASAGIVPDVYRNKPADILLAIGLGQSMGLSPAESLYRINVIHGKPTASAELVAANVRKAGHKLEIMIDEKKQSVVAVLTRADDKTSYTITRDIAWAKKQSFYFDRSGNPKGLWATDPLTMLTNRAITAVARLGASETLYGVIYTSDEIIDNENIINEKKSPSADCNIEKVKIGNATSPINEQSADGGENTNNTVDIPKSKSLLVDNSNADADTKNKTDAEAIKETVQQQTEMIAGGQKASTVPTPKQRQTLHKFGIPTSEIDSLTKAEASNKISELIENVNKEKSEKKSADEPEKSEPVKSEKDIWEAVENDDQPDF